MDVAETRLFIQDPGGHKGTREAVLGRGIKTIDRREAEKRRKQPEGINNHQPGQ